MATFIVLLLALAPSPPAAIEEMVAPVGGTVGFAALDLSSGRSRLITLPNGHRLAVAVFVHASPADIATRERTIARLARLAYDAFSSSTPAPK